MRERRTCIVGRVLSIFFGVLALAMLLGKWLDLYQVPLIMGRYAEHKYSLFEVHDFLSAFDTYVRNDDIAFAADFLLMGTIGVLITNIAAIILGFVGKRPARAFSVLSSVASVVLAVVCIAFVVNLNAEVEEATYGGIDELLRLTAKPWFLMIFSVLQSVCLFLKEKPPYAGFAPAGATVQCRNCGVFLPAGTAFCTNCGVQTAVPNGMPYQAPVNMQNAMPTRAVYCTNCGKPVQNDAAFCTFCGKNLH